MPRLPRILSGLAALAAAGALCAWLLAPEAARSVPALASWAAWKEAKKLDLEKSRDLLEALSGAVAGLGTGGSTPAAASSGSAAADRDRLAWDAATLDALSGSWQDAAAGFARAALSGSTVPREDAFSQLGNALYRLGERDLEGTERLGAWALAVESYGKSLAAKFDQAVWENREFVLGKLREEARKQAEKRPGRPDSGGSDGQSGQQPSADDLRSLEQQMRDAARQDQELRKWLRPDGRKPAAPRLPSELLRDLMGGDAGGAGEGEKKDW